MAMQISEGSDKLRREGLYLLTFIGVGHAIFTALNMLTMSVVQIAEAPQIALSEVPFNLGLFPFVWFGTIVYFFGSPIGAMPMVLTTLIAPFILSTHWSRWTKVFAFALLGAAFSDFWTTMSMPNLLEGPWEAHVRVVCGAIGAGAGYWVVEHCRFASHRTDDAHAAAAE